MNAGKAIYYILSNATSVTDICGTRIYPELAEQEAPTPFVVYEVISVDPDDTNDGPAKLDEVTVDITAVADVYDTCADLASAIRAAIDRIRGTYNGVNVDSVQYSTTDTDVMDSPRRYAMTAKYIVRISRDLAQIATGQPIDLLTILRLADTPSTYGTTGQALVMNTAGDALEWGETASALGDLTDVELDDLQDHEALVYDQDTATWINGASTKLAIRVINTGFQLPKGTPVRATGVQGDQVIVAAFNASQHDPKTFIGMLDDTLANGATGYARQTGTIYHLNTSPFEIGDILYPKDTPVISLLNGMDYMTTTPPTTPGAKIACAIVLRKHENTGRVYVRTWTPSRKLGDLDDVDTASGDGNALVYNGTKWLKGLPNMELGDLRDVQDYDPASLQDKTIIAWDTATDQWQMVPQTGFLPTADRYFLNRYDTEAGTGRTAASTASVTVERYLTIQGDGEGESISAQSDTASSGNVIRRKIWYKANSFEQSDVDTWTLVHTFADDTAYSATEATFEALLNAQTYGTPPFTLAQTWEDVPAFTGLLDTYTGAAAAYSLRLLDGDYAGSCIRVRRASDNAEQDIGFSNNELDTAALATFCAGTDGFIKTWYDQSGNANDATQATTASQPKIYDASTGVELKNGKPILNFTAQYLAASWDIGTEVSCAVVCADVQQFDFITGTNAIGSGFLIQSRNNIQFWIEGFDSNNSVAVNPSAQQVLITGAVNSTNQRIYANDLSTIRTDSRSFDGTGHAFRIGYVDTNPANILTGKVQEVIFWNTYLPTDITSIHTAINDHYTIY